LTGPLTPGVWAGYRAGLPRAELIPRLADTGTYLNPRGPSPTLALATPVYRNVNVPRRRKISKLGEVSRSRCRARSRLHLRFRALQLPRFREFGLSVLKENTISVFASSCLRESSSRDPTSKALDAARRAQTARADRCAIRWGLCRLPRRLGLSGIRGSRFGISALYGTRKRDPK
jgi:hypothetical protein